MYLLSAVSVRMWPRQESNLYLELRKLLYYPLYYEAFGVKSNRINYCFCFINESMLEYKKETPIEYSIGVSFFAQIPLAL